ncbi:MAG TPA: hypothetical protein VFH02_09980 [Jiangellaceae bacterium]|nr:hypothetical protein [Jiangellaceae bacterium]
MWELSVAEQRYRAVLAVIEDGFTVTDLVGKFGVSRQSLVGSSSAEANGSRVTTTIARPMIQRKKASGRGGTRCRARPQPARDVGGTRDHPQLLSQTFDRLQRCVGVPRI